eukprot:scaffold64818_cov72-Phaeocystis_antarctica.AAC.5
MTHPEAYTHPPEKGVPSCTALPLQRAASRGRRAASLPFASPNVCLSSPPPDPQSPRAPPPHPLPLAYHHRRHGGARAPAPSRPSSTNRARGRAATLATPPATGDFAHGLASA